MLRKGVLQFKEYACDLCVQLGIRTSGGDWEGAHRRVRLFHCQPLRIDTKCSQRLRDGSQDHWWAGLALSQCFPRLQSRWLVSLCGLLCLTCVSSCVGSHMCTSVCDLCSDACSLICVCWCACAGSFLFFCAAPMCSHIAPSHVCWFMCALIRGSHTYVCCHVFSHVCSSVCAHVCALECGSSLCWPLVHFSVVSKVRFFKGLETHVRAALSPNRGLFDRSAWPVRCEAVRQHCRETRVANHCCQLRLHLEVGIGMVAASQRFTIWRASQRFHTKCNSTLVRRCKLNVEDNRLVV